MQVYALHLFCYISQYIYFFVCNVNVYSSCYLCVISSVFVCISACFYIMLDSLVFCKVEKHQGKRIWCKDWDCKHADIHIPTITNMKACIMHTCAHLNIPFSSSCYCFFPLNPLSCRRWLAQQITFESLSESMLRQRANWQIKANPVNTLCASIWKQTWQNPITWFTGFVLSMIYYFRLPVQFRQQQCLRYRECSVVKDYRFLQVWRKKGVESQLHLIECLPVWVWMYDVELYSYRMTVNPFFALGISL